jgi:hypothetical protein
MPNKKHPAHDAIGFHDWFGHSFVPAYFIDALDSSSKLTSLFNPESLDISKSAEYGELNAIGWSSSSLQYAFTKSPDFSISLEFSLIAMHERGLVYPSFEHAINYFNSFLHGSRPGKAPHQLMFVWPQTVSIVCAVKQVRTAYKRWSQLGAVMAYGISLSLQEVRSTFLSSRDVLDKGAYRNMDKAFAGPYNTGTGIKLGKG